MKRSIFIVLCIILVFGMGYYSGNKLRNTEPIIDYIRLPPVQGGFDKEDLSPVLESQDSPIIYKWVYTDRADKSQENLTKIDSNGQYTQAPEAQEIDTLESLRVTAVDWNIKRTYNQVLFNSNDIGKLDIGIKVQYNKLDSIWFNYTPVQKNTIYRPTIKKVQPFVRASYNSLDQVTGGVGLYINKIGIDVFYIRDGRQNKSGIGAGLSYRF